MKIACMFAVIGLACLTGLAAEKKVRLDQLPPAVRKTVDLQSAGAALKGLTREIENGKTQYEAELRINGRTRDVIIDPDGKVLLVEEELPVADLPTPVKIAFDQAAKQKGRLVLAESLREDGRIIAYEGHFKKGLSESELKVDPSGKPLPQ